MSDDEKSEIDCVGEVGEANLHFYRSFPVYQAYEAGNWLISQVILEFFFQQSHRIRRSMERIGEHLAESFEAVEYKVEANGKGQARHLLTLQRDSILVVLSDSSLRATKSFSGLGFASDLTGTLKSVLQFSVKEVRRVLKELNIDSSFLQPPIQRTGTRIDLLAKIDQPKIRQFDRRRLFNEDWLCRFADKGDKLGRFSITLQPDTAPEHGDIDTTIQIGRKDGMELQLAVPGAGVNLKFGPTAEVVVIRGHHKESRLKYELIDDTIEFTKDHVTSLFDEGTPWL